MRSKLTNVSRPPAAQSRTAFSYHCEEDSKLGVHINHVPVGEDKLLLLVLLALKDDVDLLGGDRQNRQLDAVELIKAAPGSGLSQTWRDTYLINENLPTSSTCTRPSFVQMVGPLGGSTPQRSFWIDGKLQTSRSLLNITVTSVQYMIGA